MTNPAHLASFSKSTFSGSTTPASLCTTSLSRGGVTPGQDGASLTRANVTPGHAADPETSVSADVTCTGKKRPKSDESMGESGEESPKRQCQRLVFKLNFRFLEEHASFFQYTSLFCSHFSIY